MRSPTETAHLIDSHYRRSFGRPPDNEMREFIRNAAENGLTADELINCMTAAVVTYGFGAYERDYRKVFVAEARKIWKMKNGKKKASPRRAGLIWLYILYVAARVHEPAAGMKMNYP